jgi:serine palmitoyltransferase
MRAAWLLWDVRFCSLTVDVHMELEEKIASFLQVQSAILYSQSYACVTSVVPAFAKRGDIIVADEKVNFAVQKAIDISRASVFYFKHNDMEDLQALLLEVDRKYRDKKLTRRFIVVEGLYQNIGDICPLVKLLEFKKQYKYRLIVDETFSIGAIGSRGKGISDYFSVAASEIDIIIGSLAHSFGANGGFCAGTDAITDHQRLSGQGYCFSASLPALMAASGWEAIDYLESNASVMGLLAENISIMREMLFSFKQIHLESDCHSPLIHLRLKLPPSQSELLLDQIVGKVQLQLILGSKK